ncbi:uncharacterized protein SCHCODRAFT_01227875 [Schizophyllum commune H4-8]|uniref:uncharacterized protein n=1 Tax=Schizophyllum commune (strain H4-8 / FGSC 9210) TaxID=578458 RepID=UPI00215F4AD5|nr:uncharacterized protein SCHCODRAFT_01227875 [Schizophyllum commune H4-8]KAI5894343.1 hypothetical protein SCHCODRAFT_01227875 [Schizophyllum commune H4-8]
MRLEHRWSEKSQIYCSYRRQGVQRQDNNKKPEKRKRCRHDMKLLSTLRKRDWSD